MADIDVVKVVGLSDGSIKRAYPAKGATFLNDVEITKDGIVYISDTFSENAIYRIKDGNISLWLKSDRLNYPNSLKIKGDELFVATWGVVTNPKSSGKVLSVNLLNKEMK